ncbi:MAG: AbrB/MazE/SpoVT family DNA-binding domain-containing protein [Methylocystis sp.]|nr:AbrB/MazE/SpoVT family DNA-binding domain-containing protein [Methylocystis sp.]MCA3582916.1 AbrB/MazE/SpoVT family DNA-binding domain-containing protein [Methylocystis sp.]MCA3589513.1 AbrB/MazE/SpoVT family DNA-binding domain-containing protein [Methylocystis sp.]MCA3590321.1 AbrB/MazE/SpoVT family DNA-binding domain-containing protein [Methylocystis sp.]
MEARKVSLFRNGRSQAVRIPKEFELPGKEAMLRLEDGNLVIEPIRRKRTLLEVLATLDPIEEEFPVIEDLPAEDVNI